MHFKKNNFYNKLKLQVYFNAIISSLHKTLYIHIFSFFHRLMQFFCPSLCIINSTVISSCQIFKNIDVSFIFFIVSPVFLLQAFFYILNKWRILISEMHYCFSEAVIIFQVRFIHFPVSSFLLSAFRSYDLLTTLSVVIFSTALARLLSGNQFFSI